MARGGRAADAANEDRKLKMMQYLQRQGFQDQAATSKNENAKANLKLKQDKLEFDKTKPKPDNTGSKNRDFEFKLAKDYANDKTSSNTAIIRQSLERARAVANYKDSSGKHLPGNDMSLVYALMKANDPPSTIREGEFQMGSNLGGLDDKILGLREKALNGTMNDNIRAGILASIETLADAQEKAQQEVDKQYDDQARHWNVDPELVIGKRRSKYVAKPEAMTKKIETAPTPAGTGLKPIHQMTREEKLKELEELGGG